MMSQTALPDAAAALVEVALDAARAAGALVSEGWRKNPVAWSNKGRIDLVTRFFDRESETLLREVLGRSTPFPIVGEEQGGERARGSDEATWYVDPIDGTTNFVHGHPFWCVSVGLFVGQRPAIGVVVAPSLRRGMDGHRRRQGDAQRKSCRVSDVGPVGLDDALLATGFPYDRRTSEDNNFDAFVAIKRQCQAVRQVRGRRPSTFASWGTAPTTATGSES